MPSTHSLRPLKSHPFHALCLLAVLCGLLPTFLWSRDGSVSDSGHRVAADLSEQVWRFDLSDPEGAEAIDFDDSLWPRVSIPHTWNALDAQDGKPRATELRPAGYRMTAGWYRQTLDIPVSFSEQRTFLRFSGASVVKDLYVNGRFVGQHRGAFAAFAFEITDFVSPGEPATIAIRVDNTRRQGRDYRDEPIPFNMKQLDIAPLRGDFNLYGGLYRGIELLTKPVVCISPLEFASPGIYVDQKDVTREHAKLSIDTLISNAGSPRTVSLIAELTDADGKPVASATEEVTVSSETTHTLELGIDQPRLWDGIQDPYRYTLHVTVANPDGTEDTVTQRIGIRSLVYEKGIGFVLNGKPIRLHGVNRHQDWQDRGWAITRRHHEIDFEMIREIGSNAVRLAHYPQDAYVLELCDRLGLITFIEIPLVGVTHASAAFEDNLKEQLQEMIHQHYNRAGIPMWGLWNELRPNPDFPNPKPLVQALHDLARAEDPSRPTIAAADVGSEAVSGLRDVSDLLSWNLYPGWYGDSAPSAMAEYIKERIGRDDRDLIGVSEYGAGASIYQHEDWSELVQPGNRAPWHPEEWQSFFHEETWAAIAASEHVWGSFVWNMFDFAADHRDEGDRQGINDKGLVTHDRSVRKDAFFFYKAVWTKEPVLHITSRRYTPRPVGAATIKVYSNADSVKLRVNGKQIDGITHDGVIFQWPAQNLASGETTVEAEATINGKVIRDRIVWEVVEAMPQPFAGSKNAN